MRVFIVTDGPFPIGMAPTKRIKCFAKSLQLSKVECKVLVFSRVDSRTQKNGENESNGIYEGVPFVFIGKDVKVKSRIVSKIRSLFSQVKLLAFFKKHLNSDDVVYAYVHDKYTFLMDIAIHIVHNKGAKYVRELCELPFGKGKETKRAVANRKRILKKQFPQYDGVIAISSSLAGLAKEHVNNRCKVFILPILVEYDQYDLEDCSDRATVPYVFHSGSLTEQKDGILGMIEAFGMACKKLDFSIQFICTGSKEKSMFSKEIDELIKKYQLFDKLFFKGFIDNDTLRSYLKSASLVIINKYPTQQNEYCFSTKLGEYMAAGKPIIITNVGEATHWLTNRKDSIIVETNNLTVLSDAIVELFASESLRKELGNNARKTCLNSFDYKVYSSSLKQYFYSLIQ